ncbi:MAG: hypothetical protein NZM38_05080 [Cytophagales bacterium]|nr:hypothetical protein [Cytophagales bacterium]MDW8384126.1 hypothetical protein [Flammeovirgaceae bacterium]
MSSRTKLSTMNNSTDDVTLYAMFVSDILAVYKDKQDIAEPIFKMAEPYDLSNPLNLVPIELYNNICEWIENNLGPANLKVIGSRIGEKIYDMLLEMKIIHENSTPEEVIRALVHATQIMIQDPLKRGWEILEVKKNSIRLRRTQTFNGILQLGLLRTLVQKTGCLLVNVEYIKRVSEGDEFDEYLISWKN